ncbi:MAG: hypothetical protein EA396_14875 [Anaerolineaceae bacterium]|nr:MAG: hypothetical protein EA396_14875 [Anaerolineaceae bacterium]
MNISMVRRWARAHWPPLLATLFLLLSVADFTSSALSLTGGQLVYALDDAYIHMSIARNLVEAGVWGVTPYGFASASSSPLWTALIALSYIPFGANEITPFALNLVFAIALNFALHHVLTRHGVSAVLSLVVQLAVIILVPVYTLILGGMEHVLQILVNVLFIGYAAQMVSESAPAPLRSRQWFVLLLLGALVGSARYEGLFLVLIFCVWLALRWRVIHAILLGAVSIAPTALFGLYALAQGWSFLPTSLLVKSDAGYLSSAGPGALLTYFIADTYQIFANQHVFSLMVLTVLAAFLLRYARERTVWDAPSLMGLSFVVIAFVNVRLVSWPFPGTYARYEAYLVPLGLLAIAVLLSAYLPRRLSPRDVPAYMVALLLVAFLFNDIYERYRFLTFDNPAVTGSLNIYQQQYQMAGFLREHYPSAVVAANDIGAINYFTAIDNVDLWGLGTIEVARARADNQYNTRRIYEINAERGTQIALVYEAWFYEFGGLPSEWRFAGAWVVANNVILGDERVSFFAVDPNEFDDLRAALDDYAAHLPEGVLYLSPDDLRDDDNDDDLRE